MECAITYRVRKEARDMQSRTISLILGRACLALSLLPAWAGGAAAIEYSLTAKPGSITLPDGEAVPIWGFAIGNGPVTVPGPKLVVPQGEGLTIHLTNLLPVPVSVVIPGQKLPDNNTGPVWTDWPNETTTWSGSRPAGNYTARVRSFVHEVAPGQTGTYVWSSFKEGAFLYQSGTNPAMQVQMGLYGAVIKNFDVGQAYGDPTTGFDKEVVLVYSALDPAMNKAIASGQFGPGKAVPNTRDYQAKYFLINGKAWPDPAQERINRCTEILPEENVLLRFLNAGYKTFVPIFLGPYVTLRAEDGNLYPFPKEQYSLELAAGRSVDVWLTPQVQGSITLYDGRGHLTNAGAPTPGGLIAKLQVGTLAADSQAPVVTGLSVSPNPTGGASTVALSAVASDLSTGCSNIQAAEYWIGSTDPGQGYATPMDAADGAFDSAEEALQATIDVSGLPNGLHTVWVRARDATGWGNPSSLELQVGPPETVSIYRAKYGRRTRVLRVFARSTAAPGSVTLTAVGFGELVYRPRRNDYLGRFRGVASKPAKVTVVSTGGGSDTKPVPYRAP